VNPSHVIRDILVPKIRELFPLEPSQEEAAFPVQLPSDVPALELALARSAETSPVPSVIWDLHRPKILVIGSSTGGPSALERIFSEFKGPASCPIVIVQHMPPVFTASLAERLGKLSGIRAGEAKHGEEVKANNIYIAPGDYHIRLVRSGEKVVFELNQGPLQNFVRPAVDPLFETAAALYGDQCLAVVLTGMGEDGRIGAREIKKLNGAVVIQSQQSCVVFGMPGAIMRDGTFDKIGDIAQIVSHLKEKVAA
jgi:two-component system chemotaxis response regulator CheB